MSEALRELQRRFEESGALADEAAWLAERVRRGEVTPETLARAALLGEPAARAVLGADAPPERIREAHGMTVPATYRRLWFDGLLSWPRSTAESWAELVLSGSLLWFTDFEPLEVEAIADWDYGYLRLPTFVPFAKNGRADVWAWYTPWCSENEPVVVFGPREEDEAEVFAPDFAGFLFRRALEEFSGSWLGEEFGGREGIAAYFRQLPETLRPYLPARLTAVLEHHARRAVSEPDEGIHLLMEPDEAKEIAKEALDFDRFDVVISPQFRELD